MICGSEVPSTEPDHGNLLIEHFAFTATGVDTFLKRVEDQDCAYDLVDMSDAHPRSR